MDEKGNEQKRKKGKKENIEIVAGDGSNLNISPVYDHIKLDKPNKNDNKKQEIVIPKSKNKKKN